MNLHLAQDEKFIDFVINDTAHLHLLGENEFCIYTDHDRELRFVKSKTISRINVTSPQWNELFQNKIRAYSRVFIHYLDPHLYDQVGKIPPDIKVIWCFFGHDGFFLFPADRFLQPTSKKFLRQTSFHDSVDKHGTMYYLLYPLFWWRRYRFVRARTKRLNKAILRMDYFGHFMVEDFDLICSASQSKMTFLPFTFNALDALQYDADEAPVGQNILIGNSATITNNHFEVINKLKEFSLGDRKIYCPLSYGDGTYADEVIKRGREAFGNNFVALQSFLPLAEYKKILHSCGFVFMNHNRSQASDNILINLSSGSKVFMSEQSPLYLFLKKLGLALFTTQHDMDSLSLASILPAEVKEHNREKVAAYFGKAAHEERLKKALSI